MGRFLFVKQQATWKISYPIPFLCVPEYKMWEVFFPIFFFFFVWQNVIHLSDFFSVCLKTRGSKKAIQSGRQWYILWRKGTCFPNKPTATTPLGSGFPLLWSCSLSLRSQSYLHFSYCSECVPLDTVRVSSTPKHIRVPSIKHFKLHQLPRESDPLHLKHV